MRYKNPFPAGVKLPEISISEEILKSLDLNVDSSNKEVLFELCRKGLRDKEITKFDNRKEYYDRTPILHINFRD